MATFKALLGVLLIALVFENKGTEAYENCPSDWQQFGDFCYWVSWTKEDYEQAREDCHAFDSHMVVPHSAEENKFINDLVWTAHDKVWLGCDDLENEGTFVCEDTTPSDYSAWNAGEPDNAKNTIYKIEQDCMAMAYDAGWIDLNCVKLFHYVCKKAL